MFVTHGPVHPESGLFVGRTSELKKMETWLTDVNCVGAVMGARQTGKTSLLLKLRHTFQDKYAFAFIDLQAVEGASPQECFDYISEQMIDQLSEITNTENRISPRSTGTFCTFLREFSKRTQAVRIIVILDEIGAVPPDTALKLASTIRSAFTARFVKPELAKYVFLLAGATDMLELTTGRTSPLGNVTERIYLGDLSVEEVGQLLSAGLHYLPEARCLTIASLLHTWTSGHPYWTQLLASNLDRSSERPTEGAIKDNVELLLRTEDRNLPHLIKSLNADNGLWNVVESLLNSVPVGFSRANSIIARLELIGILKDQDGRCAIRNRIYQEAMHRHQIKPVRLFAANLLVLRELIAAESDLRSLLRQVARFLQQVLQTRSAVIYHKGPRQGVFEALASVGVPEGFCDELRLEAGSPLLEMLEKGISASDDDRVWPQRNWASRTGSTLLVPILFKDKLLGILSVGGTLSGEKYESQDREFLGTVAWDVATAIHRMSLHEWKQEAERALEIQRGLLPRVIPQIAGFQISGAWQPARFVSGDYYDVFKLSEHEIALCLGDVIGKGMPAALLMSNLQASVRSLARPSVAPGVLCTHVNHLTANNVGPGKFITFFYAVIDGESRRLTYTNAGHNAGIILRNDASILRLDDGGPILGVFPDCKYQSGEVDLACGDRLFLFTDGVTEAQNSEGDEFGEERLIELLTESRHLSAADLQRKVIASVTEFSSGHFHDDVTAIALSVH